MEINVTQERTAEGTRRTMTVSHVRGSAQSSYEIYYDLLDEFDCPEPVVWDGFVFGIVLFAMSLKQDIHVKGPVSRQCIRNIREFQEAWACMVPERYTVIQIKADCVCSPMPSVSQESAMSAYSGGVDSIFTLLRHGKKILGDTGYPLNKSVLLVHGFDVPLHRPDHLVALKERIKPLTDEMGLSIKVIRTNSKALNLQDWGFSFAAQLAACLHQYSHEFQYGLVGSSEPYSGLVFPWGSTPATDFLLSGSTFQIVHDGAGFSRTLKVKEIAKNPVATSVAKVCYEGVDTFENCGACEKCVRTRFNFLAAGVRHPACFETPTDEEQLDHIVVDSKILLNEFEAVLTYARAQNIKEPWVDKLSAFVERGTQSVSLQVKISKKIRRLYAFMKRGEYKEILLEIQVFFQKRLPH